MPKTTVGSRPKNEGSENLSSQESRKFAGLRYGVGGCPETLDAITDLLPCPKFHYPACSERNGELHILGCAGGQIQVVPMGWA